MPGVPSSCRQLAGATGRGSRGALQVRRRCAAQPERQHHHALRHCFSSSSGEFGHTLGQVHNCGRRSSSPLDCRRAARPPGTHSRCPGVRGWPFHSECCSLPPGAAHWLLVACDAADQARLCVAARAPALFWLLIEGTRCAALHDGREVEHAREPGQLEVPASLRPAGLVQV